MKIYIGFPSRVAVSVTQDDITEAEARNLVDDADLTMALTSALLGKDSLPVEMTPTLEVDEEALQIIPSTWLRDLAPEDGSPFVFNVIQRVA